MNTFPTLALSVRRPKAYLAGCLKGDACLTAGQPNSIRGYIQLRVADWDFAEAFSDALFEAFGVTYRPRPDERGYAFVRTYNGHGRFDELRDFVCAEEEEFAAWLRGLFDSEGNTVCVPKPTKGPNSWDRRIAIFSTNEVTLARAQSYLEQLGIASAIKPWSMSKGHKGALPVFAVIVQPGKGNYQLFADRVGSSIGRKTKTLRQLPTTYHPDLAGLTRKMQARAVETRIERRNAGGTY